MATAMPPGGIPLSAAAWHDLSPGDLASPGPGPGPGVFVSRDLMFLVSVQAYP